jgi:polynucleotide 5'-kinase involved in rRNA processing
LGYKKYLKEAKMRLFHSNQIRVEDALSETGGRLTTEQMEGMEEGLLMALQDAEGSFLGIGVFCGVDSRRGAIRIYTPVGKNVSTVCVGQVELDRKGREIV